jgi:hypothetical protein
LRNNVSLPTKSKIIKISVNKITEEREKEKAEVKEEK